MYKVDILPECESEEEYAAIMSAIYCAIGCKDGDSELIVRNLKRTLVNVPDWGRISRHERFSNQI